jgi:predicted nucleic-acid-binding Zn-ribbon protein
VSPDARTYRKCPKCGCEDYTRRITKTSYTHKTKGFAPYRSNPKTTMVWFSCEGCPFSETWDKYKELREKEKKELDERVKAQMKEILERKI